MSAAELNVGENVSADDVSVHSSERSSHAAQSHGAASPRGDKEDLANLQSILRTVAQALNKQADLQKTVVDKCMSGEARSKTLSTIRIPAFDGHPNTPVKTYRDWKKDIASLKILNKLSDKETALVLYTNFAGRTKQLVECLEISEIRGSDGLARIWQILDDAFEQMSYERMADAAFEAAHVLH